MKKSLLSMLALGAIAAPLAACDHSYSAADKPPGTYKSSSESTNSRGTTTKTDTTTHVYKDSAGNKKAVVTTDKTTDPKGLFNKKETTSTRTYQ